MIRRHIVLAGVKTNLNRQIPRQMKRFLVNTMYHNNKSEPLINKLPLPDWDRGGRTEKEHLTPLYSSIRHLIDSNPGCVCLIQVGSFYELYFEQALENAGKLGLKLAYKKTNNYSIPMSGFPVYQLQKFVRLLVQESNVSVAIIDQYPQSNKSTETIIHRKISRIVSPGTLVDETFLNYNQNNYLVAISLPANCTKVASDPELPVGLSWIDVSIGEFYVQQTTLGNLISDLSRVNPSEIILSKEFQNENLLDGNWYGELQGLRKYFIRYHKVIYNDLKSQFRVSTQASRKSLENFSIRETAAMNMVLSYVKVNLPETDPSLDIPQQYWNNKFLQMDSRTREALELTERLTGGSKSSVGSLLSTIRRTVTPSGNRLLTQWIKSPIVDVDELRKRQKFVSLFREDTLVRTIVRNKLSQLGDFTRSVQKISFKTGDSVTHLVSLANSLQKLNDLKQFLDVKYNENKKNNEILGPFLDLFYVPTDIMDEIFKTLHSDVIDDQYVQVDPEVSTQFDEDVDLNGLIESGSYKNSSIEKFRDIKPESTSDFIFSVKRDHDPQLTTLHEKLDELLATEKDHFDAIREKIANIDPKLTVTKKFQHGRYTNILHISGKVKLIEAAFELLENDVRERRKATLLYKPFKWSEIQVSILDQVERIKVAENEILQNLRLQVLQNISIIREAGRIADYLDITTSFAVLAEEGNLVCPRFVKKPQLNITGGRHIVVESAMAAYGEMFIPNDTRLGSDGHLWVISGPNMGGKSTFLRQNALIVILSQIGSFVPADSASIGIVDKIFTRIGASDDLYSDLSTFMVEMVETSHILKNATPNSLAIVDEVGRGTSGKEGLAIAYATLVSLLKVNKCRTLFATHYGKELDELLTLDKVNKKKLRYFRTRVLNNFSKDTKLKHIIDHTLEPGISDRSYALEVAKMAGFPNLALEKAMRALKLIN